MTTYILAYIIICTIISLLVILSQKKYDQLKVISKEYKISMIWILIILWLCFIFFPITIVLYKSNKEV